MQQLSHYIEWPTLRMIDISTGGFALFADGEEFAQLTIMTYTGNYNGLNPTYAHT